MQSIAARRKVGECHFERSEQNIDRRVAGIIHCIAETWKYG
jgi:hypothetical protein